MSDASSLRSVLKKTDLSAPAIQGAAGSMMKHYDKSPGVAVTEWRNVLHQARQDQYLPLLYVANEVLQNSKRNRGNKFLEAFSPTLGQSLIFISQRSTAAEVEKIRRTIKIWAERHVFSVRYVTDLLKGLEPYRKGGNKAMSSAAPIASPGSTSPATSPAAISAATQDTMQSKKDFDRDMGLGGDDSDDDNDDDLFASAGNKLLDISIDFDQATASTSGTKKKRRRSSASVAGGGALQPHKQKRRSTILSTNSLMELWNQVSSLQSSYDRVQGTLQEINSPKILDESVVQEQIDTLVGDQLLNAYKKTIQYEDSVARQRRELYDIAQRRRALELEAVRYLPWLEAALKQDEEDLKFCEQYGEQLKLFTHVQVPAKAARDERVKEEEKQRIKQEQIRKKQEEEEERKKFMESAMSKQTEAQPGMVWNKATGEYQFLNQDESWRD